MTTGGDTELCYLAKNFGYRIWFVTDCYFYHIMSKRRYDFNKYLELHFQNNKNYPYLTCLKNKTQPSFHFPLIKSVKHYFEYLITRISFQEKSNILMIKQRSLLGLATGYLSLIIFRRKIIRMINSINFNSLAPGVWAKVSLTVTTDSNATSFAPHILAGAGLASTDDTVEIWGVQVEQKDHSTTTIPTFGSTLSRSVTSSLFDISGYNASLDMSNVSFNSSGNPTFDGSNDYITVAHANSPITNKSYEMVFRPDSIPASNTFRSIWQKSDNWNGDTGISMQFIYNNFTFSYGESWGGSVALAPISSYVTAGNWYHVVGTVSGNGGSAAMYINGSLAGTGTAGTPTTTVDLTIGLGNGGSLLGDIPIFRMYSETLSAAQVQQNYLAYKKRFGI
jgi:hypothetical protein